MTFPFKDPADCRVTAVYGVKGTRWASGKHDGIDIVSSGDKTILSVTDGKVIRSGVDKSWGQYVVVQIKDGRSLVYAHMLAASRKVSVGDTVSAGQAIGTMGSTGNSTGAHLHIELQIKYYQSGNTDDIAGFLGIENEVGEVVFLASQVRYNTVDEMPAWAQESVQYLIGKGFLAKSDEMDLSLDMVRTFVVLARVVKKCA